MGHVGEVMRVMIPLLLITLLYAQTYYLGYGIKLSIEEGSWDEKREAFVSQTIPIWEEAYKVEVVPLLNNTTATLFLPVEGLRVVKGEGEIREGLLRVVVDSPKEIILVGNGSIGKPQVVGGVVERPPEKEEPKETTLEVVEKREEEETVVVEPTVDEESRKKVEQVLNISKPSTSLNLPPLGDVFLIIIVASLLIALSLIIKHYKPKEREGREPIQPYMYEVEIKKPPKVEE